MITRKQILCSIRDNTSYGDDNGDKVFHHDRLQHPYDQSSFFLVNNFTICSVTLKCLLKKRHLNKIRI